MKPSQKKMIRDLALLAALVALINIPLLTGGVSERLVLFPERLRDGQWHLLILHAFVHVSPYHLLLDAGAFLSLYAALRLPSARQRLAITAGGIMGSALATLLAWPAAASAGLCGLSGVAHGLMAVCGLEMLADGRGSRLERTAGGAALVVVALKAATEAVVGHVLFAGLHAGNVGLPVAVCHAGGIIGALMIFALMPRSPVAGNAGSRNGIARDPEFWQLTPRECGSSGRSCLQP